jgi:hypothetical protein
MSKVLKALVVSAAATGVAALALNALDLQDSPAADASDASFPGFGPDEINEEDVDALMNELAQQLNF